MECGHEVAATVFGPSYKRASKIQVGLVSAATISGVVLWLMERRLYVACRGFISFFRLCRLPLFVMMPINKELLDPGLDKKAGKTRELLYKWGQLMQ